MGSVPDVSIIIISTNEAHELEYCIDSLKRRDGKTDVEIIIFDNASSDSTTELVKERLSEARLIVNETKTGFASNNNRGIEMSRGRYILLLNPDTIISPETFSVMVDFMDRNSDVGAAACKLVNPDGTIQHTCRRFPTPGAVFFRWAGVEKFFPNSRILSSYLMKNEDHDRLIETDWLLGAFLMLPRKIIDEVGLLDTRFDPLYYEDIDLCYRIKKQGYRICYYPETSIVHLYNRESAESIFNKMTYIHFRNIIRFFRKHRWRKNEDFTD